LPFGLEIVLAYLQMIMDQPLDSSIHLNSVKYMIEVWSTAYGDSSGAHPVL